MQTRNQETIVIVGTKKILINNHSDQENIDIINHSLKFTC